MGVRTFSEAPAFLGEHVASTLEGYVSCGFSRMIRQLSAEQKQQLVALIPQLIGHLRSGKARKAGDRSALARIGDVLASAQQRAADVMALQEGLQSLAEMLSPEALEAELAEGLTDAAADLISQVAASPCAAMEGTLKVSLTLAPVVSAMELARSAGETARQITLLWNSAGDLLSLLDFDLVADELLDQLESQLVNLAAAMVDEGAAEAERFIKQRLSPDEWIKAVQP